MTLMKMSSFSKAQDKFLPEDLSILFPIPAHPLTERADVMTTRGHCRSMSAPAKASANATWDLSPCAFQQLKENWQGWKWKMMRKNPADKRKRTLFDRRVALEEDVAQLQTQLHNERSVRQGLERALGQSSANLESTPPSFSPKTKELVSEIAILEAEVASLEQHVLHLYREVLDKHLLPIPSGDEKEQVRSPPREEIPTKQGVLQIHLKRKKEADSSPIQHRRYFSASPSVTEMQHENTKSTALPKTRHASLLGGTYNCIGRDSSQESSPDLPTTAVPTLESTSSLKELGTDAHLRTFVSESRKKLLSGASLSTKERGRDAASPRFYSGSPNRLSEELVRCMAAIYCKLADPPLSRSGTPASPSSSSSSTSSSARELSSDSWSPRWRAAETSSGEVSSTDQFQATRISADVGGAYSTMVEVPWICVDKDRLTYAARALRNFRSMVEQLEKVDPYKMKHDEKLAFWINVYNALMMHAFLAYGIPVNNLKRMSLGQKATYKIGGHSINAHTIEHCILGCRSRRPTQWLQTLFSTGTRFKAGDERKGYALEKPEPLVCFALCCGGLSDPAIHVYTAKHIREELQTARRDYLQASIGIRIGTGGGSNKVLLPRILEWYARDVAISPGNLLDWVCEYVTEKQRAAIKTCLLQLKPNKSPSSCLGWLPYNCSFRYIFASDLARRFPLSAQ